MTEGQVLDIARQALYTYYFVLGAVADYFSGWGLVVSIFQTVTSIQEQTLTFVPKIICVFLGMMIFGSWILNQSDRVYQYALVRLLVYIWVRLRNVKLYVFVGGF